MDSRLFVLAICIAMLLSMVSSESIMIPMRDGVQLNTDMHYPLDFDIKRLEGKKFGVVLIRTPYGASGVQKECQLFNLETDLVCAAQDFRGRYKSEGHYSMWLNASTDAYDTMKYFAGRDWCSGKVMSWGASAPAIAAYFEPMSQPEWLKSQFNVVGMGLLHQQFFQQGAYLLETIEGWLTGIGEQPTIAVVKANEAFNDLWAPVDMSSHWSDVNFPALHYGGWYDPFCQQQLLSYRGYQDQSSAGALGEQILIFDPLGHCAGGQVEMPGNRSTNLAFTIAFAMFKAAAGNQTLSTRDVLKTVSMQLAEKNGIAPQHAQSIDQVSFYVIGPNGAGLLVLLFAVVLCILRFLIVPLRCTR
eukprot:TRINITY_DN8706_c0_g1_i2.p1 TRINITY_DN8706_c0_g1~~TRINITY_DN8706_c0_g1_i2.p1  ORF type:complete len:367 (+),score=59.34 TRINITY_DN8706_c0_g1_i2:25-1101(+)